MQRGHVNQDQERSAEGRAVLLDNFGATVSLEFPGRGLPSLDPARRAAPCDDHHRDQNHEQPLHRALAIETDDYSRRPRDFNKEWRADSR